MSKVKLDDEQIGLLLRALGHMSVDMKLIKRTRKTLLRQRERLSR